MKAVSYESKEKMAVSSRAKPALKAPTDALIISGKAKPGKIGSYHTSIDDGPDAYKKFDKRIEGYTKVLIRMNGSKISGASARSNFVSSHNKSKDKRRSNAEIRKSCWQIC